MLKWEKRGYFDRGVTGMRMISTSKQLRTKSLKQTAKNTCITECFVLLSQSKVLVLSEWVFTHSFL